MLEFKLENMIERDVVVTYITNLIVLCQVDEHWNQVRLEIFNLNNLGEISEFSTGRPAQNGIEFKFCSIFV